MERTLFKGGGVPLFVFVTRASTKIVHHTTMYLQLSYIMVNIYLTNVNMWYFTVVQCAM